METIESLHLSYCFAAGLDLRLNPAYERWWFEALKWGVTPDDVKLVVKWRIRETNANRGNWSIQIHKLIRDEEDLAIFVNQAAVARAELRAVKHPPGKIEVLRASGRETEIEAPARSAQEALAAGIEQLKRAAR